MSAKKEAYSSTFCTKVKKVAICGCLLTSLSVLSLLCSVLLTNNILNYPKSPQCCSYTQHSFLLGSNLLCLVVSSSSQLLDTKWLAENVHFPKKKVLQRLLTCLKPWPIAKPTNKSENFNLNWKWWFFLSLMVLVSLTHDFWSLRFAVPREVDTTTTGQVQTVP